MHERLQVNAALTSRHGHNCVSLSLVALIKQLRDKPDIKARFISLRKYLKPPGIPSLRLPTDTSFVKGIRAEAPIAGPLPHTPALKRPGAGLSSCLSYSYIHLSTHN